MTAAVAVVTPCYNAAATLAATLESALAQDVAADIVVVDDGSTDGSLAVARAFEPRVRVTTGPNRGVSAARNTGIAITRAPWLVFLDADDLLAPGTLARRIATAQESRADVVVCDWEDFADDAPCVPRTLDWPAMGEDAERAIASHVWATTAALMYRRTLVEKVGGFRADLPVIQDARFMFDAARAGARFAHDAHVGAFYRIVAGSLSRRAPVRFWRDVLTNARQIEALWRTAEALSPARRRTLLAIYDQAARGLFAAGDADYFAALAAQRALGLPLSRHARASAPLARLVGLRAARALFQLAGRR